MRHQGINDQAVGWCAVAIGCVAGCAAKPAPVAEPRGMPGTMPRDMETFSALTRRNTKVQRSVRELPNGIESVTESNDPEVSALIIEHADAMKYRIEHAEAFRPWDPLFAAIFANADKIKFEITRTPKDKGVKVIETSDDAYAVLLIKAHAKSVDRFVEKGIDIIGDPHEAPARP